MRSSWVPVALLVSYLVLMFMVSRLLDLLAWCHQGAATDLVDPIMLSVRQLKQLLELRGVSYTGYYEKRELAQLVQSSAPASDISDRGGLAKMPNVRYTGRLENLM
ncbi:hypothetical protein J6590_063824 [Homalodisca vitripennis]|nr:hypothetical protein J6590_063824 [Homalodisca vitripennis]